MMNGLSPGVRRKTFFRGRRWPYHIGLTITALIIAFPLLYAMLVATQTNAETYSFQFTPGSAFWSNLNAVWVKRDFAGAMMNSLQQALLVTTGKTILSLLAGLAFVYFKFRGKWIVFGLVLITLMMPTEVMILAMFRLVGGFGWQDTMAALVVPFLASATGAFLFRQHFANMPTELLEASQIDGASPVQFLRKVLIPLSWNVIAALFVIQFVYTWNMFLWPSLIIRDESKQVVQAALQTLTNIDGSLNFGPLMLAAVLASLPPGLVFILMQKPFMSGFAIGQDK
ncbi:Glycerol-3-phosphate ABC transporter, permease protein UgpE (TC 3.A.1.1.3) [hydrothermal vent metagenome]|uniref:Glycerol-3-phosphate ABC transporter, permease protein UgpE (TC 3.A.1.1.3) n=1 Tax=hydrothermal vent metagenome TaxID=652676 RepID=A0A3B0SNG9_9ZZZZ